MCKRGIITIYYVSIYMKPELDVPKSTMSLLSKLMYSCYFPFFPVDWFVINGNIFI